MSSMTFPTGEGSQQHDGPYYAPPFDVSSSFQMNPLSSHPPRTPRTSMISSTQQTHHYEESTTYDTKEERELSIQVDDEEFDETTDNAKESEKRIGKEHIWREMVITSNGRDKAFKLIQYSLRVYLLFHNSLSASRLLRRPTRAAWEVELVKRLQATVSGLSFTRKTLLLFNWLSPLTTIMAQQAVPYSSEQSSNKLKEIKRPFLHTVLHAPPPVLLEFVHSIADDVATLSRIGLLGKKTGERASRFSDWCWLLVTFVGLVENGVERQINGGLRQEVENRAYSESMTGATARSKPTVSKIDEKELARLTKQDYWLQITRAKLVMDFIFVCYELFNIQRAREPVKAFTGLTAAILSSSKLYDRHKTSLLKSLSFGT